MMQRMKGTLRPGRKAGVLALAVLLLTCVLMAGAVSADEGVVTVSSYGDLVANLSSGDATTIILNNDIDAEGLYEICLVCGWEDDGYPRKFPDDIGANGKLTLNQARKLWAEGKTLFPNHPNPKVKK